VYKEQFVSSLRRVCKKKKKKKMTYFKESALFRELVLCLKIKVGDTDNVLPFVLLKINEEYGGTGFNLPVHFVP
jgi:translation initiation factor 2 alpha subunit (eIF-2alpha)